MAVLYEIRDRFEIPRRRRYRCAVKGRPSHHFAGARDLPAGPYRRHCVLRPRRLALHQDAVAGQRGRQCRPPLYREPRHPHHFAIAIQPDLLRRLQGRCYEDLAAMISGQPTAECLLILKVRDGHTHLPRARPRQAPPPRENTRRVGHCANIGPFTCKTPLANVGMR